MDLQPNERVLFLKQKDIFRISPLIEYAYQEYDSLLSNLKILSNSHTLNKLINTLQFSDFSSIPNRFSFEPLEVEFMKSPNEEDIDKEEWDAFLRRVERAAIKSGLENSFSASLAATLGEMVENIIIHSSYRICCCPYPSKV